MQYHENILHANIVLLALKRHQLLRKQLLFQIPKYLEQRKRSEERRKTGKKPGTAQKEDGKSLDKERKQSA